MLKKILLSTLLSFCMMITLLSGCGNEASEATGEENAPIRIGLCMKTTTMPFYVSMEEGVMEAAEELGWEVISQSPEGNDDNEKQLQIIENMISQQVDVLLFVASGSKEIIPAIKKCNEAGIPAINLDSRADFEAMEDAGAYIETFIGSDNVTGGYMAGKALAEVVGTGAKVAVLEGTAGQEVGIDRVTGFMNAAEEFGLEVVASQPADWDQEKGYTVTQNIMMANPDVTGIFGANDLMALGSVRALEDSGLAENVTVIGFDADDDARAAIAEGRMYASIAQNPQLIGRTGVEMAKKLLDGETLDDEYPIDVIVVTKENVES